MSHEHLWQTPSPMEVQSRLQARTACVHCQGGSAYTLPLMANEMLGRRSTPAQPASMLK